MKRFLKLLLTYFLVTIFAVVMVWGIYTISSGEGFSDNYDQVTASVIDASDPVARVEKAGSLFKEEWRLTYSQTIWVEYELDGKRYKTKKEVVIATEYYDSQPKAGGREYPAKYRTGIPMTIFVNKSNPNGFNIAKSSSDSEHDLKSILKVAIPIYVLLLIMFTVSHIKKSKELKKQKLFDSVYEKYRY